MGGILSWWPKKGGVMKRAHFFVIFATIILSCLNAFAFTASYEQTIGGAGQPVSDARIIKIKDNKMRMEMDTPQGRGIVIIDGDTMLSYIPSQKKAIKMKSVMHYQMNVLSDYVSYLNSLGARNVGSDRVGLYDCDVYEYTDPRINIPSKVWLWKAHNFPVKVEMKSPAGVMTTMMKDVKVGVHIDDSEFMLPPGIEIVEESQMREDR